jgi:D-3-phosphoglycerate dehydrogenase / 2-oxoglutarate reductase
MKIKVLITAKIMIHHLDAFKELFEKANIEVVLPKMSYQEGLSDSELIQSLVGIDCILCGDDQLTSKVLDASPSLKVISKWGTGVDSIDVEYAKQKGVPVYRVTDVFSHPVSDTILAYMLEVCRGLQEKNALVRSGRWQKTPGFCLNEKTLGVIGGGAVGLCLIKKALAFGMKVFLYSRTKKDLSQFASANIVQVDIEELLVNSDFISLNCAYSDDTHHILSAREFALVKESSFIINTSRGRLIDEPELINALSLKKIAGAFLDVFSVEPLPSDSPLLTLDNVYLSPHNANASKHIERQVCSKAIDNLVNGLRSISQPVER